MSKAANGQQMQLKDALLLLDKNGDPIKWEKAEDGSYSAKLEEKGTKVKDAEGKDKQLAGNTYIYSITPQTTIVDVGVVEQVEGQTPEGPLTGEEAKKADKALEEEAKKSEVQAQHAQEVTKQADIEKSIESSDSRTTKSKK